MSLWLPTCVIRSAKTPWRVRLGCRSPLHEFRIDPMLHVRWPTALSSSVSPPPFLLFLYFVLRPLSIMSSAHNLALATRPDMESPFEVHVPRSLHDPRSSCLVALSSKMELSVSSILLFQSFCGGFFIYLFTVFALYKLYQNLCHLSF